MKKIDRTHLMVFRHLLASVAEEMGLALQDSAISSNIKERRDFSCAVLDASGQLIAHAAHIPVHIGSAHLTVHGVLQEVELQLGDVVVLNDPHRGGTHLNDVTVVSPIYAEEQLLGYLLNRAHHADVGGAEPGSMSGAQDIYGEGLCLPPVHLIRAGEPVDEVWRIFTANTRDADARRGDLLAQCAALRRGEQRFLDLVQRFGVADLRSGMQGLLQHGQRLTQQLLKSWPQKEAVAMDYLDGPDSPRIRLRLVNKNGRLLLDFRGSSDQVPGSWNTHKAITYSALFYVLQALARDDLPETSGTLKQVDLELPAASWIAAEFPAGVAAGNVETSQRIVDVLLAAFRKLLPKQVPASSQGTMNNLLFGGQHRRTTGGKGDFVYYETLGGGSGAGPKGPGASAIQVHMTNTRNTPIEVLEVELPVRVWKLALRRGSGGRGHFKGGDGLVKELEFLEHARVSVTGTRRKSGPPGAAGGSEGKPGVDYVLKKGRKKRLKAGQSVVVEPGDRVRIETPGGGGYRKPKSK